VPGESLRAVAFREEPTVIAEMGGGDNVEAGERSLFEFKM